MSLGFPTRFDTNWAEQPQKKTRNFERLYMYYLCIKNKGADQLRGYRAFVFAYSKGRFSHDAAQMYTSIISGKDEVHI